MNQLTKITLAFELSEQGVPRLHIAKQIGIGRTTLYLWLNGIEKTGDLEEFLDQYLSSKKGRMSKTKSRRTIKA